MTPEATISALRKAIGPEAVEIDAKSCLRASRDYFWMSPILDGILSTRPPAFAIARPSSVAEVAEVLRIAFLHEVQVTPRGKGTGNYGQSVPWKGGIVLDLTGLDRIRCVEKDWIHAEAGCNFDQLEEAAHSSGQELQIIPSTTKSTLGGFIGGGAGGAGSVEHGFIWNHFIDELEVLPCSENPEPFTVKGPDCNAYLHAFGTTGVIVSAKARLRPKRNWTALFFSFDASNLSGAASAARAFTELPIIPRLNTIDLPDSVALLPEHRTMPNGRISLRPMVDQSTAEACIQIAEQNGGRLELESPEELNTLHLLSYNHFTLRAKQKRKDFCHLQLAGDSMIEKTDEILSQLPEATLHFECRLVEGRMSFGGLIVSRFIDEATLQSAINAFKALGLMVVNVHKHTLGEGHLPKLEDVLRVKALNDPKNLLNSGRMPSAHLVS